jgi:redox-sensing transcriptional repressor
MSYGYRIGTLPHTTVQRLPSYLRLARELRHQGREVVSSARIAERLNLEAIQVRKDFGFLGITGRPKTGYLVEELIKGMEACLNWNRASDAVLVGVGHLGAALLGYEGFAHHGVHIAAAFDLDPDRMGGSAHGRPVSGMDRLLPWLLESRVRIAILTVSPEAAQEVTDLLCVGGVQGIWNFTGRTLQVPGGVIVQDQDIATGLALLTAKLAAVNPPT